MSLKDEVEKLIATEGDKLVYRDNKNFEFLVRQKKRFTSIKIALEELTRSLDPRYVQATVEDDRCKIKVGTKRDDGFLDEDIAWEIEPNFTVHREVGTDICYLIEQPGFRVDEGITSRGYESDYKKNIFILGTERELLQDIIAKTTKQIAQYEWTRDFLNRGAYTKTEVAPTDDKPKSPDSSTPQTTPRIPVINLPIGFEVEPQATSWWARSWFWWIVVAVLATVWLINRSI